MIDTRQGSPAQPDGVTGWANCSLPDAPRRPRSSTPAVSPQMSSRSRLLIADPASQASVSLTGAGFGAEHGDQAARTRGAMVEALPHTRTTASFCMASHTRSANAWRACWT